MVSQLYNYGDFLLRVGIQCDIDIKAYLISFGTVYLDFGVITPCKLGFAQLYWA